MTNAFLSTQPYKGTRDFYPHDMRFRRWMFEKLRGVLHSFGYEEYDGPMLEPFELYASKTSEEIVNEQLYWLVDRGERKLAVRPEMTPTLARMVAAKLQEIPKPIRWFSIPNLWRYERPQRGRLREHWQLNVDLFGGKTEHEELELCVLIASLFENFGAKTGFEVRLNHRELTNAIFSEVLKIPVEKHATIGRLWDAAPKMGEEKFKEALLKEGLNLTDAGLLCDLFKPDAEKIIESKLGGLPAWKALLSLREHLESLGLKDRFRIDPSILRGFQYYTGLVLEVYDLHPQNNRALFGGGRYANLVGLFGPQSLSGIGFGMGDVTFQNFLETHSLVPELYKPSGVLISPLQIGLEIECERVASALRSSGTRVFTTLHAEKPKKAFAMAEKLAAEFIVFIGESETISQTYELKNVRTGLAQKGPLKALVEYLCQNQTAQ